MLLKMVMKFHKTPKATMFEIKLEKNISGYFSGCLVLLAQSNF